MLSYLCYIRSSSHLYLMFAVLLYPACWLCFSCRFWPSSSTLFCFSLYSSCITLFFSLVFAWSSLCLVFLFPSVGLTLLIHQTTSLCIVWSSHCKVLAHLSWFELGDDIMWVPLLIRFFLGAGNFHPELCWDHVMISPNVCSCTSSRILEWSCQFLWYSNMVNLIFPYQKKAMWCCDKLVLEDRP